MLTKEEIEETEKLAKLFDGLSPDAVVLKLITHIREQDAELTKLREHCKTLKALLWVRCEGHEQDIASLTDRVRELEAEVREFVELTATLTPCTPNQYLRAQAWLDAHPAPK